MKKQTMTLAGVPAVLYGERSRRAYLYLHGKNGCKEEAERFAATACEAGWQVLAIDLPEHGAWKNSPEQLLNWREAWASAVNRALEEKQQSARVTHLSHTALGLDEQLTAHEGSQARKLEMQGMLYCTSIF